MDNKIPLVKTNTYIEQCNSTWSPRETDATPLVNTQVQAQHTHTHTHRPHARTHTYIHTVINKSATASQIIDFSPSCGDYNKFSTCSRCMPPVLLLNLPYARRPPQLLQSRSLVPRYHQVVIFFHICLQILPFVGCRCIFFTSSEYSCVCVSLCVCTCIHPLRMAKNSVTA